MRRGTTPTHTFTPDIDLTGVAVLYVTYKQDSRTIVEKNINDVTIAENKIQVTLTQAETLSFSEARPVEIQIRLKFSDGAAMASNIIRAPADRILKDGEI